MVAVFVVLRLVVGRESIMAAGKVQVAFLVQIFYAFITLLVAAMIVEYPRYDLIESAIKLKVQLVDPYIFFLVFLFGVRTADDAIKVIKGLLLGALLANGATILDALGFIDLGFRIRTDGRTAGAIGESNQYAVFIVMFLPATIAAAVASRGVHASVLARRGASSIRVRTGHDGLARWFHGTRDDLRWSARTCIVI